MNFPRMKTALAVVALLAASQAGAAVPGFAGNVTGGGSATPVAVNSLAAAQAAVNGYSGSGGLVLRYTGTFDEAAILNNICAQWSKPIQELSISSKNDITILGADGSAANFGIRIKGTASNIIVRNMKMGLLPGGANNGDIIGIESNAHHVWIDHNELYSRNTECPGTPGGDTTFDGALDIKNSATNITVSYNYIHDHSKVGLDGSSDSDSAERRITYAHNRYENVGSRLPLQRFGYVHVYNNYYNGITGSGINVRMTGRALIENNWFENAVNPVTSRSSPTLGDWDLRNNNVRSAADNARYNITWSTGSAPFRNANTWTTTAAFPIALPYTYTTYPPDVSRCIAINAAGVGNGLKEAADVLSLCGQASSLAVAPGTVQFAPGGSSATIAVTANVSWTVMVDAPWLFPMQASGSNNGSFTVTAVPNNSDIFLQGTITVTGGGLTRSITVTQIPQLVTPTLTVSPAELSLSGRTQSVQVTVSSNVAWTVSGGEFVLVSPTSGSGNGTLTLSVSSNPRPTRVAVITVTGGGLARAIHVSQGTLSELPPFLDVTPRTLAMQAGPSATTLSVSATAPWFIRAIPPWLTFTPVSGGSDGPFSVTAVTMRAEANPSTSPRTAVVQFLDLFGGPSRPLLFVTQAGQAPPDGPVAATAVTTSSGPWFTEQQVRLTNTAPITQLQITITVQRTAGVNHGGQFNTVGGGISQGAVIDPTTIRYTFSLNAGQTLAPGIVRTFAAQSLGSGTAHPTSGDTYEARGVAGGREFTLIGSF